MPPTGVMVGCSILGTDEAKDLLDLTKPVALSLVGVSVLILSHATHDFAPDMWDRAVHGYKSDGGGNAQVRNKADVARFSTAQNLSTPALIPVHRFGVARCSDTTD